MTVISAGDEYVTTSPWAKACKLHVMRVIPNKGGFTVEYKRFLKNGEIVLRRKRLSAFKFLLEQAKWSKQ